MLVGPMCAGKSDTLIKASEHCQAGRVAVVSHHLHRTEFATHSGRAFDPERTNDLTKFVRARVGLLDNLFVDEAQFFGVQDLVDAVELAANDQCSVYLAGLDFDYRREPFPWVEDMHPGEIYHLTATCSQCNRRKAATLTAYTGAPFGDKFAPNSQHFHPRCPDCWIAPCDDLKK